MGISKIYLFKTIVLFLNNSGEKKFQILREKSKLDLKKNGRARFAFVNKF